MVIPAFSSVRYCSALKSRARPSSQAFQPASWPGTAKTVAVNPNGVGLCTEEGDAPARRQSHLHVSGIAVRVKSCAANRIDREICRRAMAHGIEGRGAVWGEGKALIREVVIAPIKELREKVHGLGLQRNNGGLNSGRHMVAEDNPAGMYAGGQ